MEPLQDESHYESEFFRHRETSNIEASFCPRAGVPSGASPQDGPAVTGSSLLPQKVCH